MTWVIWALGLLALGAAVSVLTSWSPVLSLRVALGSVGLAGAMSLAGTLAWSFDHSVSRNVEWPLPLGFARLAVDGLSAWFLAIIGFVCMATSVYTWGYFGDETVHRRANLYGPLICLMTGAMVLVVCAADVLLFLLGWELMSLSAFFLVGFHDDAEARRGAWTYLVATHLGTALGVLPVFAAFVARTGQTSMMGFAGAFGASEVAKCTAIFVLGIIGFGTKAGFMPFHVWLPAAHPVAPSPVSALMSGVVIKTGVYGLLRLLTWLPELPARCAVGLMIISLVTGLMGILYALGQRHIKRMLAYSSVENVGIIGVAISLALLGRALGQPVVAALGLTGALLHVLNHALFKSLLFLSAGAVMHGTGSADMERLGGLAHDTPVNAMAFLAGSVAICALPPLNGFVSEFAIYAGLFQGVMTVPSSYATMLSSCAAVLAMIGGLALVVFSKSFSVIFLGSRRDPDIRVHLTPPSMKVGMMALAIACAGAGIGSFTLAPWLGEALQSFGAWTPQQTENLAASLGSISKFTVPLGLLIVIALGLVLIRKRFASGAVVGGAGGTWGCGYALPRPSMQYTASSFGWKMIVSFRGLIRPTRRTPAVEGCFPSHQRLATSSTDLVYERIYKPIFGGLAKAFERLWPLQHGRIQLYLVYIVLTVFVVFVVEAWSQRRVAQPGEGRPSQHPTSLLMDSRSFGAVNGSKNP